VLAQHLATLAQQGGIKAWTGLEQAGQGRVIAGIEGALQGLQLSRGYRWSRLAHGADTKGRGGCHAGAGLLGHGRPGGAHRHEGMNTRAGQQSTQQQGRER
jgi:hypothetical protein